MKLETKELLVFEYIRDNIKSKGYAPSVRDICNALQIKSTSTVHACIERLEQKGYIRKDNGKSRALRLGDADSLPDTASSASSAGAYAVPLIVPRSENVPFLSEENYEGFIQYPTGVGTPPENEMFALRVADVGMLEVGLLPDDIVIVERASTADNGDIVVALVDGQALVRTFYKEDGHFRLQPENRTMLPLIVNSLMLLGRVVTSVRYY